ncbi:unnamed protein product, partial [Polarella glacialis]
VFLQQVQPFQPARSQRQAERAFLGGGGDSLLPHLHLRAPGAGGVAPLHRHAQAALLLAGRGARRRDRNGRGGGCGGRRERRTSSAFRFGGTGPSAQAPAGRLRSQVLLRAGLSQGGPLLRRAGGDRALLQQARGTPGHGRPEDAGHVPTSSAGAAEQLRADPGAVRAVPAAEQQ